MGRPRAADDFAAIRARMEELRREREQAECSEDEDTKNTKLQRISEELRARIMVRRNWPAR
jgi:hypothetical protein